MAGRFPTNSLHRSLSFLSRPPQLRQFCFKASGSEISLRPGLVMEQLRLLLLQHAERVPPPGFGPFGHLALEPAWAQTGLGPSAPRAELEDAEAGIEEVCEGGAETEAGAAVPSGDASRCPARVRAAALAA